MSLDVPQYFFTYEVRVWFLGISVFFSASLRLVQRTPSEASLRDLLNRV